MINVKKCLIINNLVMKSVEVFVVWFSHYQNRMTYKNISRFLLITNNNNSMSMINKKISLCTHIYIHTCIHARLWWSLPNHKSLKQSKNTVNKIHFHYNKKKTIIKTISGRISITNNTTNIKIYFSHSYAMVHPPLYSHINIENQEAENRRFPFL